MLHFNRQLAEKRRYGLLLSDFDKPILNLKKLTSAGNSLSKNPSKESLEPTFDSIDEEMNEEL